MEDKKIQIKKVYNAEYSSKTMILMEALQDRLHCDRTTIDTAIAFYATVNCNTWSDEMRNDFLTALCEAKKYLNDMQLILEQQK